MAELLITISNTGHYPRLSSEKKELIPTQGGSAVLGYVCIILYTQVFHMFLFISQLPMELGWNRVTSSSQQSVSGGGV